MSLGSIIRSLPVTGPLSYKIKPAREKSGTFRGSADYWDQRYARGGTSGAGSYNRLAEFKAEVINEIVDVRQMDSVIEFGCGDGAQLLLAKYANYIGVDVSPTILDVVRQRFTNRPGFTFLHTSEVTAETRADLGLSLDVIYHLVEDETFDLYMRTLFEATNKIAVFYASNEDRKTGNPHVRHRKFSAWIDTNRPDFVLVEQIANEYPSNPKDPDNTSVAYFYVYRRSPSERPADEATRAH